MPLHRADRLFDIIRILRAAAPLTPPLTAAASADELGGSRGAHRLQGCRDVARSANPGRGCSRRRGCAAARVRGAAADVYRGRGRPAKAGKSVLSQVTLVVLDPLRD